MTEANFAQIIHQQLGLQPTTDQQASINAIADFLLSPDQHIFILKGYAGTGKTTLIAALVQALPYIKSKAVLLAPTGRAAKVMSKYSGASASTIHRRIYKQSNDDFGGFGWFLNQNKSSNTLFIVDESSMVAGEKEGLVSQNILEDLYTYVMDGTNCKVILVGDEAQLPPVGQLASPALDPKVMEMITGETPKLSQLKQVVRQAEDSGILYNATYLRDLIGAKSVAKLFDIKGLKDVVRVDGTELEEVLNYCYQNYGEDETIVITRSNKRANLFNRQIRARILWREERITAADKLMVVKNNYFWVDKTQAQGFIANGDMLEIQRIGRTQELYGYTFCDATLTLIDYPNAPTIEAKIILETLDADAPSLTHEQYKQLYLAVAEDYEDIPNKRLRFLKMKQDPFVNALQIKFSYAVTCHKSQGGQWDAVIIDQGYLTDEMLNDDYVRWLYTAITRAKQKVYLLNFNDSFFKN